VTPLGFLRPLKPVGGASDLGDENGAGTKIVAPHVRILSHRENLPTKSMI
jgi:hypothetical protein